MWNDIYFFFVNEVWPPLQPILATAIVGILSSVGISIRNQIHNRWIADGYDIAAKMVAGWVNANLQVTPVKPGTDLESHDLLKDAANMMKENYPEAIAKVEKSAGRKLGDGEIIKDILGALGNILPGPGGLLATIGSKVIKPK